MQRRCRGRSTKVAYTIFGLGRLEIRGTSSHQFVCRIPLALMGGWRVEIPVGVLSGCNVHAALSQLGPGPMSTFSVGISSFSRWRFSFPQPWKALSRFFGNRNIRQALIQSKQNKQLLGRFGPDAELTLSLPNSGMFPSFSCYLSERLCITVHNPWHHWLATVRTLSMQQPDPTRLAPNVRGACALDAACECNPQVREICALTRWLADSISHVD